LQLLLIVLDLKLICSSKSLIQLTKKLAYSYLCWFVGELTCGGVLMLFYLPRSAKQNPNSVSLFFHFAHSAPQPYLCPPNEKFEKHCYVGL
jgi:hypothetical protein